MKTIPCSDVLKVDIVHNVSVYIKQIFKNLLLQ